MKERDASRSRQGENRLSLRWLVILAMALIYALVVGADMGAAPAIAAGVGLALVLNKLVQ